jgi:hypothetical protein
MIKNKKLPVTKDSNITIMKKNLKTTSSSYEEEYNELSFKVMGFGNAAHGEMTVH